MPGNEIRNSDKISVKSIYWATIQAIEAMAQLYNVHGLGKFKKLEA